MILESELIDLLEDILGSCLKYKNGKELLFYCPFCNHKKRKLAVNLEKGFHCWVCGKKGVSVFYLIARFGTIKQISFYKKNFTTKDMGEGKTSKFAHRVKISLPKEFFPVSSSKSLASAPFKKYLKNRGVPENISLFYKIGYAIGGEYDGMIIFPSFNKFGNVNYFVARKIFDDFGNPYKKCNVANNEIVFNELNINWKKELTIVEGPFDMVKARGNVACLLGNRIENSVLFSNILLNDTPIILALDKDMRESGKEQQIAKQLLQYDIKVKTIDLNPFSDPGSMSFEEFFERKKKAFEYDQDFVLKSKIASV